MDLKFNTGIFIIIMAGLLLSSCEKSSPADKIIDKCINHHGGKLYNNVHIEFDFRDKHYVIIQQGGQFTYKRIFTDGQKNVRDVLSNDGFERYINDTLIDLSDKWKKRYYRSVNSVAYFALLPYGLNDDAVIKSLVGETTIEGEKYHMIHVAFEQNGGGEDYEDEFMYWINAATNKMDYLAYFYHTDGGGTRFRKAVNVRRINDIIVADYLNYGFNHVENDLEKLGDMYKNKELELVSEIRLEHVKVKQLGG